MYFAHLISNRWYVTKLMPLWEMEKMCSYVTHSQHEGNSVRVAAIL